MELKEINGHRFYPVFDSNSIIVDLGAHKGEFTKKFIKNYQYNKIALFEPNPDLIPVIRNNLKNVKSYQLYNRAIHTQSNQYIDFYPSHNPLASSTNKTLRDKFDEKFNKQTKDPIQIPTFTLIEILEIYGKIDLLKMDIEGIEWDILSTFNDYMFERINQISVEFHDFIDPKWQKKTEKIINLLENLGYERRSFYGSPRHGSKYMDTIFYKKHIING